MKVALLKGESRIGRPTADEMACAFLRRGWNVAIADLAAMPPNISPDELGKCLTGGGQLDLVVSFGDYADGDWDTSLSEAAGAPHVVQWLDYPGRSLEAFSAATAFLFVDMSHVRAVEKLYSAGRFAFLGFGPHGAVCPPRQIPGRADTYVDQRSTAMLLAAHHQPKEDPEVSCPEFRSIFMTAIDIAAATEWMAPLEALEQAIGLHGMQGGDMQELASLARQVHRWICAERHDRFVTAATKAGLPFTIGSTVREMQNARLVIALNGNCGRGSSEGPLTAMSSGAALATDRSAFYADAFEDGRDLLLFNWKTLEDDLSRIADLSRNPEALFAMARAGQAKVAEGHRWDNRLDGIIDAGRAATPANKAAA